MFCRNCGEVLTETEVACRLCGYAIGTGGKYCEQCGTETPSYAVVCELCGKKVERDDASQYAMQYAAEERAAYQSQPAYKEFDAYKSFEQRQKANTRGNVQPNAQPYQKSVAQWNTRTDIAPFSGQVSTEGVWTQEQKPASVATSTRKRATAVMLGLLFGSFGVHSFYLGKKSEGTAHLLLTVFGGGAISWIWAVVDAINILNDKKYKDGDGAFLE